MCAPRSLHYCANIMITFDSNSIIRKSFYKQDSFYDLFCTFSHCQKPAVIIFPLYFQEQLPRMWG